MFFASFIIFYYLNEPNMRYFYKIIFVGFLIIFSLIITQGCKEKKLQKVVESNQINLTPAQYNDSVIGFQEKVIRKVLDFSQGFQNLTPEQKESKFNDVLVEIDQSIIGLQKLGDFFGNSKLKNTCIVWMNFYKSAFENEYKEIIFITNKQQNDISDADIIRMNDLQKSVAQRELKVHKDFVVVQEEFYKQFDIKGEQNQLDKEVKNIGKKK